MGCSIIYKHLYNVLINLVGLIGIMGKERGSEQHSGDQGGEGLEYRCPRLSARLLLLYVLLHISAYTRVLLF